MLARGPVSAGEHDERDLDVRQATKMVKGIKAAFEAAVAVNGKVIGAGFNIHLLLQRFQRGVDMIQSV